MQTHTPRFRAWLDAERQAQAAERALYHCVRAYARGAGDPPGDVLVALARERRAAAYTLYLDAMQELQALAQTLHAQDATRLGNGAGTAPGGSHG